MKHYQTLRPSSDCTICLDTLMRVCNVHQTQISANVLTAPCQQLAFLCVGCAQRRCAGPCPAVPHLGAANHPAVKLSSGTFGLSVSAGQVWVLFRLRALQHRLLRARRGPALPCSHHLRHHCGDRCSEAPSLSDSPECSSSSATRTSRQSPSGWSRHRARSACQRSNTSTRHALKHEIVGSWQAARWPELKTF